MVPMESSLPPRQFRGDSELETPSALGRPHELSTEVPAGGAYGMIPLFQHLLGKHEQMAAVVICSFHNRVSSPLRAVTDYKHHPSHTWRMSFINWQVHLAPCLILDVDLVDRVDDHTSELVVAYKTVRETSYCSCGFSDDRILNQKKGRKSKQEFKCTEEKTRRV